LTDPSGLFLLAENESEEIVGFAHASVRQGSFELRRIYILPSCMGRGVGSMLLSEVLKGASHRGHSSVRTKTHQRNTAQHFFRKHGFLDESVSDEIISMSKVL
jgi:N-acetylglutamate synthase-like GNAT family acetyltransferase